MKEEASRRNDGQTGVEIDEDIIQGRAGNIAKQLCRPFRRLLSEHTYSLRILCPSRRLSPIFSHYSILCLPPLSLFFTLCVYMCVSVSYIFFSRSLFFSFSFYIHLSFSRSHFLSSVFSFYLISSAPISHTTYIEHFLFTLPRAPFTPAVILQASWHVNYYANEQCETSVPTSHKTAQIPNGFRVRGSASL